MCNVHPMNILQQLYSSITRPCFICKIEANLCFSIFDKNSKIQNGRHFWAEENFLKKVQFLDTLWIENFDKIALSHTVKEIEANLCFSIFGRNLKIQNGRHFWGDENFLKIAQKEYFAQIPCGSKISIKSVYLARLRR